MIKIQKVRIRKSDRDIGRERIRERKTERER